MEQEAYRIFISATDAGSRDGDRMVQASYALRILGNGIDKLLCAKSSEREVQVMYAKGLDEAFSFLWAEIDDQSASGKPTAEIVVRKPKMKIRFENGEHSLLQKLTEGETTATDNVDTWITNVVWATHFNVSFREPNGDAEQSMLRDVERIAKAELHGHNKDV